MAPSLSPARPTSRLLGPLPPAPEPTHDPCCQLSFQNHSSSNRLGAQRGLTGRLWPAPAPTAARPLWLPRPSLLLWSRHFFWELTKRLTVPPGQEHPPALGELPCCSESPPPTSALGTCIFPKCVTSPKRARHMASTSHSCHCTVPSTRSATQHPQRTGGAAAAPPNSRGKGGQSVNARATAGLVSEPRARAHARGRHAQPLGSPAGFPSLGPRPVTEPWNRSVHYNQHSRQ